MNKSRPLNGNELDGTKLGSTKLRRVRTKVVFEVPCSPISTNTGYGPWLQRGEQKSDDQDEISLVDIQKRPQLIDRRTALREGQWPHPRRTSEPHWRSLDD